MNAPLKREELHQIHNICLTWKRLSTSVKCWLWCFEDVLRVYTKATTFLKGPVHQLRHATFFQYVLKQKFRQKKDFKVVFKNVQTPRRIPLINVCPKTLGVHDSFLAIKSKNVYNHTHTHTFTYLSNANDFVMHSCFEKTPRNDS